MPSTAGFKFSPVNGVENLNPVAQDNKDSTLVAPTDIFKRQIITNCRILLESQEEDIR